jgi:hypothetical protein
MTLKRGDIVRMSWKLLRQLRELHELFEEDENNLTHVQEFGNCHGVVSGLVDYGNGNTGPEIDVYWSPSNLRYAYHPSLLIKVYPFILK